MESLEQALARCFGPAPGGGARFAAASEVHAVHESGFDVHYTRYSVTYRDASGELVLGAEFDDEGTLVVHAHGAGDPARARIAAALSFLNVPSEMR